MKHKAIRAAVAAGRGVRALGLAVVDDLQLLVGAGGLALLGYGLHLAWNPLGYIVPGGLVFALCVYGGIRRAAREQKRG